MCLAIHVIKPGQGMEIWEGTPGKAEMERIQSLEEDRNRSMDLGQGDENPDLSRSVQSL